LGKFSGYLVKEDFPKFCCFFDLFQFYGVFLILKFENLNNFEINYHFKLSAWHSR
jgi:hypothetical protein